MNEAEELLAWALRRRQRARATGRKPRNPIAAEKAYERYLLAVSLRISAEIKRTLRAHLRAAAKRERMDADLVGLFDEELFEGLTIRLSAIASRAAAPESLARYWQLLNIANAKDVKRVLDISPVGISAEVTEALEVFRRENAALIESIAETQIDQVRAVVAEASNSGMRVETLAKRIEGRFEVSASRARLIARDQVLKGNANLTQIRHRAVGVTSYTWSTSNDGRVRDEHADLEGTIQSYDDPPVTSENGDRNNPGEDYQCRCISVAILPP